MDRQTTVNQHYIPQCILSNFSSDKSQVYEGLFDKGKVYLTINRNPMSERDTYKHPEFGENSLKKYFGRIESYIAPAMKKIFNVIQKHEEDECSFNDIYQLIQRYIRRFLIFYYRSGDLLYFTICIFCGSCKYVFANNYKYGEIT